MIDIELTEGGGHGGIPPGKPFTPGQERRIVELIRETLGSVKLEGHEHKYELVSTGCPDGIMGCSVYHVEQRCTICGRRP